MQMHLPITCLLFLVATSTLFSQDIHPDQKKSNLFFGLSVAGTKSKSTSGFELPPPVGFDIEAALFFERKLLRNVTASIGGSISRAKHHGNYHYFSFAKDNGVDVVAETDKGIADISKWQLKIPLRFRFYYYTGPKFRIFLEPGFFWTKDLSATFKNTFERTTFFEEASQTSIDPPQVEMIQENFDYKTTQFGLSVNLGVVFFTAQKRKIIASIQYQRSRLNLTPLYYKSVNNWGLEFRVALNNFHRKDREDRENDNK